MSVLMCCNYESGHLSQTIQQTVEHPTYGALYLSDFDDKNLTKCAKKSNI